MTSRKHETMHEAARMATLTTGGRRRLGLLGSLLAAGITLLPFTAARAAAQDAALSYKVLYNFSGGADGGNPVYGPLVQDNAGNLYGTTSNGGSSSCGVVFKLTKSGAEVVLYSFACGSDGASPSAGVILSGNTLYGTTVSGGSGNGVVFAVDIKSGAETVLYTFTGGADGSQPLTGLVQDKAGNLYGVTWVGGSSGDGVVYKVVPNTKKETVLHSFAGSDGSNPFGKLTLDTTGKVLYGSTDFGGSAGWGVVYSLTLKSKAYSVLYTFTGGSDGAAPNGYLSIGKGGILYGTTAEGGVGSGYGVVFQFLPKTGKETVLYAFTGGADGKYPVGGVVLNEAGHLFSTTDTGGGYGDGTIFEVDPKKKTETVLHSFDGTGGSIPYDGLYQDSKGNFYGTAFRGGSSGAGVVFKLTP